MEVGNFEIQTKTKANCSFFRYYGCYVCYNSSASSFPGSQKESYLKHTRMQQRMG